MFAVMVNFAVYHAFILYVHYQGEKEQLKLFQFQQRLKAEKKVSLFDPERGVENLHFGNSLPSVQRSELLTLPIQNRS
jgi:hypothetical protein